MTTPVLVHEALAQALRERGIDTVFGVIGDGNLFLMNSFAGDGSTTQGRYIAVANEATAVEAAMGYGQACGRLGVATVTHGPALTNTVTPMIDAAKAQIPLLVLAGDTAVLDRDNFQNIAQREVATVAQAGFEQLRDPSTLGDDLDRAIHRAHTERRPVILNMPIEFQWRKAEYVGGRRVVAAAAPRPPAPEELDRAVGVIASARRPVVLVGRGAIDAKAAILAFAARVGAPVATTLKAKDLFRGESYDLGIFGTLSDDVASEAIGASDCVIAFGASMHPRTTDHGALLEKRRLVTVDVEARNVDRYLTSDAAVLGDAELVARAFIECLDEAEIGPTGFAGDELAVAIRGRGARAQPDRSGEQTLDFHRTLRAVDEAVPQDRVLVTDVGRFMTTTWQLVHVQDSHHFLHTINYGAIGLGMGTSIGAALAVPDKPVLLVTGDGGFLLGGVTEFAIAVRHRLDLIVVVMNDGAFGAEHVQFTDRGLDPALSTFPVPDLGPVAEALGGRGYTVRTQAELQDALGSLSTRDRPVLIDVKLDPAVITATTACPRRGALPQPQRNRLRRL